MLKNRAQQAFSNSESNDAVDAAIYGDFGKPEGKVTATPTDIYTIVPDMRQPRRILPTAARGHWDGNPEGVATVLSNWQALVEKTLGITIDLPIALEGGELPESKDPLIDNFVETVRLAYTLRMEGQREPIEVYRWGVGWKIQDGERRWLAHHLLTLHVSGDFRTILAKEEKPNVWAQATRNGARRPLNAIGMARQLALLIMDMYQGDKGVKFDPFEVMVLPGEIDLPFYAQVRDGNQYPVKYGMSERVLSVTELKNAVQIRQYRALLNIPPLLWQKADEEDWAEFAIRAEIQKSTQGERVTVVTHNEALTQPVSPQPDSSADNIIRAGKRVRLSDGREGTVQFVSGGNAIVTGMGQHKLDTLTLVQPRVPTLKPGDASTQSAPSDLTASRPSEAEVEAQIQHMLNVTPRYHAGQAVTYKGQAVVVRWQGINADSQPVYRLEGRGDYEYVAETELSDAHGDQLDAPTQITATASVPPATTELPLIAEWNMTRTARLLDFVRQYTHDRSTAESCDSLQSLTRVVIEAFMISARASDPPLDPLAAWQEVMDETKAQIHEALERAFGDAAHLLDKLKREGEDVLKGMEVQS